MHKKKLVFAMCGSFCTFNNAIGQMEQLAYEYEIYPVMSFNAAMMDTRFGKAEEFINKVENISHKKVIKRIEDAEPIGPSIKPDIMLIEPCTGNTLAKLANGIADTPVTLAAKAHLRNNKPLLIAVSTNDALSSAAKNIGFLLNNKNIFFVPFRQDDCEKKPRSAISDFTLTAKSLESAIDNKQLQPIIFG